MKWKQVRWFNQSRKEEEEEEKEEEEKEEENICLFSIG
jgi:hypothetical protein